MLPSPNHLDFGRDDESSSRPAKRRRRSYEDWVRGNAYLRLRVQEQQQQESFHQESGRRVSTTTRARRRSSNAAVQRVEPNPLPSFDQGWKSRPELHSLAQKYGGLWTQYRIEYHTTTSLSSSNTTSLQEGELKVTARFASKTGSIGGNTHALKDWRLPGGRGSQKSIFDDTRPSYYNAQVAENAHPIVVLAPDIAEPDSTTIRRFLCVAPSGTTLLDFCTQQGVPLPGLRRHAVRKEKLSLDSAEQHTRVSKKRKSYSKSPPASVEKDDEKDAVSPDDDREEDKEEELPLDDEGEALLPFDDQENEKENIVVDPAKNRLKQTSTATATKRRRKTFGSDRAAPQTLQFTVETNQPRFFAVVEGILTGNPQDYEREIFLNGQIEKLPTSGRVLELLPAEVAAGTWTAKVVDPTNQHVRLGLLRDPSDMNGKRILLRHDGTQLVGPLRKCLSGFTLNVMDPSLNRMAALAKQGIVDKELGKNAFVGSLSVVLFDGFSSNAECNTTAYRLSKAVLSSLRKNHGRKDDLFAQDLISVPAFHVSHPRELTPVSKPEDGLMVGFSFLGNFGLEDAAYSVVVARDETSGKVVALDVVFQTKNVPKRWDLNSSSPCSDGIRLTEDRLLSHATSTSPDDPIKRLWGASEKRESSKADSKGSVESVYEPAKLQTSSPSTNFQDAFEIETGDGHQIRSHLRRVSIAKNEMEKTTGAAQTHRENAVDRTPQLSEKTEESSAGGKPAIDVETSRKSSSVHFSRITPTPGQHAAKDDKQLPPEEDEALSLFRSASKDTMPQRELEPQLAGVHRDGASQLSTTSTTIPENVGTVELKRGSPEPESSWPSFHDVFFGVHDESTVEEFTVDELNLLELQECEDAESGPALHDVLFGRLDESVNDNHHVRWRQWMASAATLVLSGLLFYSLIVMLDVQTNGIFEWNNSDQTVFNELPHGNE